MYRTFAAAYSTGHGMGAPSISSALAFSEQALAPAFAKQAIFHRSVAVRLSARTAAPTTDSRAFSSTLRVITGSAQAMPSLGRATPRYAPCVEDCTQRTTDPNHHRLRPRRKSACVRSPHICRHKDTSSSFLLKSLPLWNSLSPMPTVVLAASTRHNPLPVRRLTESHSLPFDDYC